MEGDADGVGDGVRVAVAEGSDENVGGREAAPLREATVVALTGALAAEVAVATAVGDAAPLAGPESEALPEALAESGAVGVALPEAHAERVPASVKG
jgi:hypothetical protein